VAASYQSPEASTTSLPLAPWLGNPYRLVSLWDMLDFDTGRLAEALLFLAENARVAEMHTQGSLRIDKQDYLSHVRALPNIAKNPDFR
jgi:hypothetical protein